MRYISLSLMLLVLACSKNGEKDQIGAQEKTIQGEEITYQVDSLNLKGYLAFDGSIAGKRPGVLVVHEWWGHNEYARKRTRMLAELGYVALAVDMYGDGKQALHPDDAGRFATEVMQNIKSGEKRFNAGMELLKKHKAVDPERIAAIGYCFGGGVVLHMARIGADIDGVVSFHGSLGSLHKPEAGSVKARVLVCHGQDDKFTTPEQIEAFKKEMQEARVDFQFVAYEGAKHSFTNPDADKLAEKFGLPLAYNAQADQESWKKMQDFFKEIFGK